MSTSKPKAPKPPTLCEVAERISKHLRRFAASPKLSRGTYTPTGESEPLHKFRWPSASYGGGRVLVRCIAHGHPTSFSGDEARGYLAWLDARNVGGPHDYTEAWLEAQKAGCTTLAEWVALLQREAAALAPSIHTKTKADILAAQRIASLGKQET